MRLGIDPVRLHAMRRAGELLAVRREGSQEFLFPSWQFDERFRPLPAVRQIVETARAAGIDDRRLAELLSARVGIGGEARLADLARAGEVEQVLEAIRSASRPSS